MATGANVSVINNAVCTTKCVGYETIYKLKITKVKIKYI